MVCGVEEESWGRRYRFHYKLLYKTTLLLLWFQCQLEISHARLPSGLLYAILEDHT